MESHAQSVGDVLSESLSFKLRPGASYVIDRKSSTFHPSGGNDYSSAGIRVMKFNLNSEGWCDPSTLKVFMEIHNTSTTTGSVLQPLSANPNMWFRRLRILVNGALAEDIDNYNRVCHMMDLFQSSDKRINGGVEVFGHSTTATNFNFNSIGSPGSIGPGGSAIVGFSLCTGLFSQDKFLPLKHAPIVIELELVGNPGDCLNTGTTATVANSTSWKSLNHKSSVILLC